MKRLALSVIIALALSTITALGADAPSSAASVQDIKAAHEKGEYQEALKLISRVLALKGKAAEGVDRYELLMLRADSQLRLRQQTNALTALEEAAKVAKAAEDPKGAADARAMAQLIRKSKNLVYSPKVAVGKNADPAATPGPMDITDSKKRKDALEGLYGDEKLAAKAKVTAADKAKTLSPVATALKAVVPLRDLELAATGKDTETSESIKELVNRAHKLMSKSMDDMTKRTEKISAYADEMVEYQARSVGGGFETRYQRRGVDKESLKELNSIIDNCKLIAQSCKELTQGFTDDTEPFEDLEDLAKETAQRANDVKKENGRR